MTMRIKAMLVTIEVHRPAAKLLNGYCKETGADPALIATTILMRYLLEEMTTVEKWDKEKITGILTKDY